MSLTKVLSFFGCFNAEMLHISLTVTRICQSNKWLPAALQTPLSTFSNKDERPTLNLDNG